MNFYNKHNYVSTTDITESRQRHVLGMFYRTCAMSSLVAVLGSAPQDHSIKASFSLHFFCFTPLSVHPLLFHNHLIRPHMTWNIPDQTVHYLHRWTYLWHGIWEITEQGRLTFSTLNRNNRNIIPSHVCKSYDKVKINETKSSHTTFTLRRGHCPPAYINQTVVPQAEMVKYLGLLSPK